MDHAEKLLAVIWEESGDLRDHLDDDQYRSLLALARHLVDVADDPAVALRAVHDIRHLLRALPGGHPVWPALNALLVPSSQAPGGPVPATSALLTRPSACAGARAVERGGEGEGPVKPTSIPEPEPGTDAIVAEVQRRLLTAPSLSAHEARHRCAGGPPPELIRLDDPLRGERYPAFQFAIGSGGPPIPVVRRVNRLLMAHVDPWGAADWWLSGNTWLGGPPVSFLGMLPDEALTGVARALVEGD
ncbi:hypothetical protein [Streptomyces sp. NPDC001678]|uniref:hypothetical protein n=1 Tax=Streptomyces sp. NPDC001678 TaxID=3364599 RepID=UPI0036AB7A59